MNQKLSSRCSALGLDPLLERMPGPVNQRHMGPCIYESHSSTRETVHTLEILREVTMRVIFLHGNQACELGIEGAVKQLFLPLQGTYVLACSVFQGAPAGPRLV